MMIKWFGLGEKNMMDLRQRYVNAKDAFSEHLFHSACVRLLVRRNRQDTRSILLGEPD